MEFILDARLNARIFWILVELLDEGRLMPSQIKKPLYLEEYNRYKGV